jgi:hypothetical protein
MGKFDVLAEDSGPAADATSGGKMCSVCSETKPQAAFSNKQWSGKAHSRKCLACVENPPADGGAGGSEKQNGAAPQTPPPFYDEYVARRRSTTHTPEAHHRWAPLLFLCALSCWVCSFSLYVIVTHAPEASLAQPNHPIIVISRRISFLRTCDMLHMWRWRTRSIRNVDEAFLGDNLSMVFHDDYKPLLLMIEKGEMSADDDLGKRGCPRSRMPCLQFFTQDAIASANFRKSSGTRGILAWIYHMLQ